MRLIHSADWQIGKVFRFVDDATMHLLQDARIEAIATIGRLALDHGASVVLVAGDVYDSAGVSDRTLGQPIERMRAFPMLTWHLIPGNHDPHMADGLWDRARRRGLPENLRVHLEAAPCPIADGVHLLPAPLERRYTLGDPTAWMDQAATPEGAVRIGLAHGSITAFGSDPGAATNVIAPDRAERAGLAYLALGDWHGMKRIGPRCWYAGTPEVDEFDVEGGGFALLIDVAGATNPPEVTPLATGRYHWRRERASIHGADDVHVLDERIRALHPDLPRLLVDLAVEGTLSLEERMRFEHRIALDLRSALCHLRLDDGALHLRPSADDLDAIAHQGFVRTAAERLRALAEDPGNPEQEIATLALMRLFVEHRKIVGR